MAPLAAYEIMVGPIDDDDVKNIKAKLVGLGGNSDRAFKALGRYAFTFNEGRKYKWKDALAAAVEQRWPCCVGVTWTNVEPSKDGKRRTGNHVVYVASAAGGKLTAYDQQNQHVAIVIDMTSWSSEPFVVGKKIERRCKVNWVGIGYPDQDTARAWVL